MQMSEQIGREVLEEDKDLTEEVEVELSSQVYNQPVIGPVKVPADANVDFPSFEDLQDSIVEECLEVRENLFLMTKGEIDSFVTTVDRISVAIKREIFEAAERRGIVVTRFSRENPLGTFGLDSTNYDLEGAFFFDQPELGENNNISGNDLVRIERIPGSGEFCLQTVPAQEMTQEEIDNASFENIPTDATVIAICEKNDQGEWEWSNSKIYPASSNTQRILTSGEQYGQAAFEGMVAMVGENGDIVIPRIEDNARRLQASCERLCMPILPIEQYVESIKAAVLANQKYLPSPGSGAKLYIRPFIKSVKGGYGVSPGEKYVFCVEVFPFGDYLGKKEKGVDIVSKSGVRRAHKGGLGNVKAEGNYAQMRDRWEAKLGEIPGLEGQQFDDLFYWGEHEFTEIDENGVERKVVKEVVEENSSANIFGVKLIYSEDGMVSGAKIMTPSLERGTILPGFTRDTILKLAEYLGYEIEEGNYTWEDVQKWDGGFLSGSAAGAVKLASMSYSHGLDEEVLEKKFAEAKGFETDTESYVGDVFDSLYQTLYALRRGEIDWIEESRPNAEFLRNTVNVIGNVYNIRAKIQASLVGDK